MDIVIFKDLTTNNYLNELEAESKKYKDLYVEMDNNDERKYVKDKASLIEGLRKKVERARIDKSKEFKILVEEEAQRIDERLVNANRPFTLLIDEHKEKRAKILADKKAKEDAEELRLQIIIDQDSAIMMDKMLTFEVQEKAREQKERDDKIASDAKAEAEARASQAEIDKVAAQEKAADDKAKAEADAIEADRLSKEREAQAKIDSDNAIVAAQEKAKQDSENAQIAKEKHEADELAKREKNKTHIGKIRKEAKECLMKIVDEDTAKKITLAINSGDIKNVTINY